MLSTSEAGMKQLFAIKVLAINLPSQPFLCCHLGFHTPVHFEWRLHHFLRQIVLEYIVITSLCNLTKILFHGVEIL